MDQDQMQTNKLALGSGARMNLPPPRPVFQMLLRRSEELTRGSSDDDQRDSKRRAESANQHASPE